MKKKIILVESEQKSIDIYRKIFQKTDFDIELASLKDEMIEELRDIRMGMAAKPDLVILDFMLADGHGIEVLKAMKKNILTRDIPVFAITNYQNPQLDREISNLGISPEKYLIKTNHTPAELRGIVESYLKSGDRIEVKLA